MFLSELIDYSYGDMDFTIKAPTDEILTELVLENDRLQQPEVKVTPMEYRKMAQLVGQLLVKVPENWDKIPECSKNRLLWDIALHIGAESLSIPEFKKK